MKLLLIHNSHRSGSSSGDDAVFENEAKLLEKNGHVVIKFNPINDEFDKCTLVKKLFTVLQIPWSFNSYKKVKKILQKKKPDIVHVHNIFPLLSPSIYYAASSEGIPVVQTLHDYRFLCPVAFLMRDGEVCEECKDRSPLRSVRHGCFNKSRIKTLPLALMLKLHQSLNTFKKDKINAYICLSEFQRKIFTKAGFDEKRIFIKPNFVKDTFNPSKKARGDYVVFIGRLGNEKGVKTLIEAWRALPDIPLKIIGDGPDAYYFKELVKKYRITNIEFSGYHSHHECMEILDNAKFLIMPSIWYETFGLVVIEAFSHAKPVIASRLGAMADIVRDSETGYLFEPGISEDLANKVRLLWFDRGDVERMGQNARREYEAKYTPERNYKMLMGIYEEVMRLRG